MLSKPSLVIANFWRGLNTLYRNRSLALELAKRDYKDRYHGQVFGLLWSFFHPLILVSIYTVIFSYVVVVRLPSLQKPEFYTIYILSGLVPWLAFAEVFNRSTTVIRSNSSLIKQVIFPVEIIPVIPVLVALLTQVIFTLILICISTFLRAEVSPMLLFLPFIMALQFLGMTGIAFALSAISAYLRDVKELIQVLNIVLMYALPIFYLPDAVPEKFRLIMKYNPFSVIIHVFQDIFYFERFEHPVSWVLFSIACPVFFVFGYWFFSRVKIFFGNIL